MGELTLEVTRIEGGVEIDVEALQSEATPAQGAEENSKPSETEE